MKSMKADSAIGLGALYFSELIVEVKLVKDLY